MTGRPIDHDAVPVTAGRRRLTLRGVLFTRRVLNQRITSVSVLVGLLVGAGIGGALGSWLAGFWLGLLVGFAAPGVTAVALDRSGRLPAWALYRAPRR